MAKGKAQVPYKVKRRGTGLEMRIFKGSRDDYLVFRERTEKTNTYHVYVEVEAKQAARDCGATGRGTTPQIWDRQWKERER
jgi:hypothetical protein